MSIYVKKLWVVVFMLSVGLLQDISANQHYVNKKFINNITILNTINTELVRERGMSVVLMGNYLNENIKKSLLFQRSVLDTAVKKYNRVLVKRGDFDNLINSSVLIKARELLDIKSQNFSKVLSYYRESEKAIYSKLFSLSKKYTKNRDNYLTDLYLQTLEIKTDLALQRDIVTYYVARSKWMNDNSLQKYERLFHKNSSYKKLFEQNIVKREGFIYSKEELSLLNAEIDTMQSAFLQEANLGNYSFDSHDYFRLISEQLSLFNELEKNVLNQLVTI